MSFSHSVTDCAVRMLVYPFVCLLVGVAFFFSVERWFLSVRCPFFPQRPCEASELIRSGSQLS
jgi:hypothetical protein